MALAGNWQMFLVLAERIGRAIRKPTVETLLRRLRSRLAYRKRDYGLALQAVAPGHDYFAITAQLVSVPIFVKNNCRVPFRAKSSSGYGTGFCDAS